MKSFFSFLITKKFPSGTERAALFSGRLTLTRSIFYTLFAALLIVVYTLLVTLHDRLLVTVPAHGGILAEGVIGAPRFINPVLAATNTDTALTKLVFAGLMKEYGDGTIVPDLAARYDISPDGRTYTFTLRDKLVFHDGSALTSSDVAFTIEKLQDPTLAPSAAIAWQDVSVSTPNESTVIITLLSPRSDFLRLATVGIVSAAQWQGVENVAFIDPSLNLSPIGAGAFKLERISRDDSGAPKKLYFARNRRYALGAPLLSSLEVTVFPNQDSLFDAIKDHEIDFTFDLLPKSLPAGSVPSDIRVVSIPTTERVELMRRSNEPALANASLLATINRYVDKEQVVATVENGYGIPLTASDNTQQEQGSLVSLEETQSALAKLGYTVQNGVLTKAGSTVAIGIATVNNADLIAAGHSLSQQLAALGILSAVQAFDPGTFQDEVSARVFGLILTNNAAALPSGYERAIPLYATAHLAAIGPNAHGIEQSALHGRDLRYANIITWHARTDRIWKWLQRTETNQ